MNTTHTVRELFKYVETVSPVSGTYVLVSGFPPKPLTDMDATLESAKLCKSAITQKMS